MKWIVYIAPMLLMSLFVIGNSARHRTEIKEAYEVVDSMRKLADESNLLTSKAQAIAFEAIRERDECRQLLVRRTAL